MIWWPRQMPRSGRPSAIAARARATGPSSDTRERVVGGLCFRLMFKHAAYIDGIVVAPELKGLGLGGTMVDDFCQRMAGSGLNLILTNFFLPDFFTHKGFKSDKRWGALVRDL